LNAEIGIFALEHKDVFASQASVIKSERERILAALAAIPNVTPFPSAANMILVRVPNADATFAALKAKGILVKNVSKMHPLLANCLRLTVGTPDENNLLLKELGTDPNYTGRN
jgi:histidinol-phosphate aminotransferase